ncbi:MAG TPA: hypothetical protein VGI33_02315 [Paenibacillus sp.]|jgi:hypothetical protein
MNANFFEEIQKLSHTDEFRYRLLIQGMRRLLRVKKEEGMVKKLKDKWLAGTRKVEAAPWE